MLKAVDYWNELVRLDGARKTGHLDYMDFAELYGDYVAAFEKGQSDPLLAGLRMMARL